MGVTIIIVPLWLYHRYQEIVSSQLLDMAELVRKKELRESTLNSSSSTSTGDEEEEHSQLLKSNQSLQLKTSRY